VPRNRLLCADGGAPGQGVRLLDVRATILEHGDQVRVRIEGSVAHELLLSSMGEEELAPGKLASGGQSVGCHDGGVPFTVEMAVAA
jgi:hypothetical protein